MYLIYLINILFLIWNIKIYFDEEIKYILKKKILPKIEMIGKAFEELDEKNLDKK